jgi:membrane protease YdiL (CAAX protease family)
MGGIGTLLYCICEEFGWRGYLQDELKPLKEWQRVLLIGFLWYLWHLSFINNQDILSNVKFLGWMILGSWGIGKVIDSTKSILAATSFHMIINLVMFNQIIKNGINENQKLIIVGVSIVICFIVIKKWERENKTIANKV